MPEVAEALAALRSCGALAQSGSLPEAKAAGLDADARFTALLRRDPRNADLLVGRARAVSQCLLPSADFPGQGQLSAQAIELLEQALEIQPTHWTARFVLANIMFRSPPFLGRAPRAAKEFDALLAQQGDRADVPQYARVFEFRGTLWKRAGDESRAGELWKRGAALFPGDSTLARLAASIAVPRTSTGAPATLGAVRVVASRARAATTAPLPSIRSITKGQALLTAGGAADVFQAVQLQPGATRVGEGSDVYTRGGDPSETALVVNGGRLLGLSRFEGLGGGMFGALEPFVIRSVRYSSGGFSARHGNALSGVLEIETDGRPREKQLRAGLSLVQMSGTARLPLGTKIGAWASARVSNTSALLATHGRTAEFSGAPHSEEAIASVVAAPTPMTELSATAIVERDDSRRILDAAGWNGAFHSAGESRAVQVASRWVATVAPVVVRTNFTADSRSSAWEFGVLARDRSDAGMRGRIDAEWAASPTFAMRAGVERATLSRLDAGAFPTTASVAPGAPTQRGAEQRATARQIGGYVESELEHRIATVTLGVRADRLPGEDAVTVDPRIAVSTRVGAWTARASGGVFHQGRFRAAPAIPDAGTPSGAARTARHVVVGVEREGATTSLRAEAFVKHYGEYVALGAGPEIASGDANGVDLIAQKSAGGRLTGWLGYSLIDATVHLADGRRARSPFDATHSATASATWSLATDWSLGSTVRFGTGVPITPVLGGDTRADGRVVPIYGSVMSDRLPAYGRVDARLMRFIRLPRGLLSTYVEALNVTNRHNVASMAYDATYESRRPVRSFFATRTIVAGAEFQFR
ncbi:MAG: porin family protein [Gemmatimonadaceae bacterium]